MPHTAVYLQKACLQHRYIRSRDNSNIVERPERLRAVNIGLAAAVARLEERVPATSTLPRVPASNSAVPQVDEGADELTNALGKLQLATSPSSEPFPGIPLTFVHSEASADLLNHPAIKFVHGDIERDLYLENLKLWAQSSQDKVNQGESEIPEGYSQGDLYCTCPSSETSC